MILTKASERAAYANRKRTNSDVGVTSDSCSAEMLGLQRFSKPEGVYDARLKLPLEFALNPFGDAWQRCEAVNPSISVASSGLLGMLQQSDPGFEALFEIDGGLPEELEDFIGFWGRCSSPYYYDESIARLAPSMPRFRSFKRRFSKWGINKRYIGYCVVNFDDGMLFPKSAPAPEWAYVHLPEDSNEPADRVVFVDSSALEASGPVFDIRKVEVRSLLAAAVSGAMERNDVDAVLIDYAVRVYAFPDSANHSMPDGWFESYQENQLALLKAVYGEVSETGRELFLNGVMLDGIGATEISLVRLFLKAADGMFWEQPFRWEWRSYHDGERDYYDQLDEVFELFRFWSKRLFVKAGSYRFHASEDIEPDWRSRFWRTDSGIERHLADYFLCMFLVFQRSALTSYVYSHPVELHDVFASLAYFGSYSEQIGRALGDRIALREHVFLREYEDGYVFVNNTLEPFSLRSGRRGLPIGLAFRTLAPLSGLIVPRRQADPLRHWVARVPGATELARILRRVVARLRGERTAF